MTKNSPPLDTKVFSVKLNRLEAAAFELLLRERGILPARFLKSAIAAEIERDFNIQNPALVQHEKTPAA